MKPIALYVNLLRQLEINNPPILRRIFVCIQFCCAGRIAGYVTEVTRLNTDKKASKMGRLFASSCLTTNLNFCLDKVHMRHMQ